MPRVKLQVARVRGMASSAPIRAIACMLVGGAIVLSSCGDPALATVSVFPIPGSRVASPDTQIAFRGASITTLGRIVVIGSRTGRHRGRVLPDSDGYGGSFLPYRPFAPGETVTVRLSRPVLPQNARVSRFTVATPGARLEGVPVMPAPRVRGDVEHFQSR